jgi:hypothetical protein
MSSGTASPMASGRLLIIEGTATISTTSLSGMLDGSVWIANCPYGVCQQMVAACTSPNHVFRLSR